MPQRELFVRKDLGFEQSGVNQWLSRSRTSGWCSLFRRKIDLRFIYYRMITYTLGQGSQPSYPETHASPCQHKTLSLVCCHISLQLCIPHSFQSLAFFHIYTPAFLSSSQSCRWQTHQKRKLASRWKLWMPKIYLLKSQLSHLSLPNPPASIKAWSSVSPLVFFSFIEFSPMSPKPPSKLSSIEVNVVPLMYFGSSR